MARWTKYNNPSRKKYKKRMSRTDADIIATKMLTDDLKRGIDLPLSFYDSVSDSLCGKGSRYIY